MDPFSLATGIVGALTATLSFGGRVYSLYDSYSAAVREFDVFCQEVIQFAALWQAIEPCITETEPCISHELRTTLLTIRRGTTRLLKNLKLTVDQFCDEDLRITESQYQQCAWEIAEAGPDAIRVGRERRIRRFLRRSEITLQREQLESSKSTLLIILNVVQFARSGSNGFSQREIEMAGVLIKEQEQSRRRLQLREQRTSGGSLATSAWIPHLPTSSQAGSPVHELVRRWTTSRPAGNASAGPLSPPITPSASVLKSPTEENVRPRRSGQIGPHLESQIQQPKPGNQLTIAIQPLTPPLTDLAGITPRLPTESPVAIEGVPATETEQPHSYAAQHSSRAQNGEVELQFNLERREQEQDEEKAIRLRRHNEQLHSRLTELEHANAAYVDAYFQLQSQAEGIFQEHANFTRNIGHLYANAENLRELKQMWEHEYRQSQMVTDKLKDRLKQAQAKTVRRELDLQNVNKRMKVLRYRLRQEVAFRFETEIEMAQAAEAYGQLYDYHIACYGRPKGCRAKRAFLGILGEVLCS